MEWGAVDSSLVCKSGPGLTVVLSDVHSKRHEFDLNGDGKRDEFVMVEEEMLDIGCRARPNALHRLLVNRYRHTVFSSLLMMDSTAFMLSDFARSVIYFSDCSTRVETTSVEVLADSVKGKKLFIEHLGQDVGVGDAVFVKEGGEYKVLSIDYSEAAVLDEEGVRMDRTMVGIYGRNEDRSVTLRIDPSDVRKVVSLRGQAPDISDFSNEYPKWLDDTDPYEAPKKKADPLRMPTMDELIEHPKWSDDKDPHGAPKEKVDPVRIPTLGERIEQQLKGPVKAGFTIFR